MLTAAAPTFGIVTVDRLVIEVGPRLVLNHHFVRVHQESNRVPPSLGFSTTSLGFNDNVVAGLPSTTFPYLKAVNRLSLVGPPGGWRRMVVRLMSTLPAFRNLTANTRQSTASSPAFYLSTTTSISLSR